MRQFTWLTWDNAALEAVYHKPKITSFWKQPIAQGELSQVTRDGGGNKYGVKILDNLAE